LKDALGERVIPKATPASAAMPGTAPRTALKIGNMRKMPKSPHAEINHDDIGRFF